MEQALNKNFVVAFFFTFFLFMPSSAEDISFSLEPRVGFVSGLVQEHLFTKYPSQGADFVIAPEGTKQVSRLDWDIDELFIIGIGVDFRYKRFATNFFYDVGVPTGSGKMQDYDWIGPEGVLTRYSCHPNEVTTFFETGMQVCGYPLYNKKIQLGFGVGFEFSRIDFFSSNGFKQYVPGDAYEWTEDIEKVPLLGDVISYQQDSMLLNISTSLRFRVFERLAFALQFDIKPVLFVNAYDCHIRRNLDFYDSNMRGAVALGGQFNVEIKLDDLISLTCEVYGESVPVVTGEVYYKNTDEIYYNPDKSSVGGASRVRLGANFGWKINIL